MRWIVGGKAVERQAASATQMGRFETEHLASDENFAALTELSGIWIDRVHDRRPPKMIILDMDSSVSPTHGEQEGATYNGHFGCTCYHPLFLFNQFGDLERCSLRPGNVHSADGWRDLLEPVVERYRERNLCRYFRGTPPSPHRASTITSKPRVSSTRSVCQRTRFFSKASAISSRDPLVVRRTMCGAITPASAIRLEVGTESGAWWPRWNGTPGDLVPRVGFIVTNLSHPAERVVAFYNHRGTAEQNIKEGKNAIKWTRLSCRKFRNNEIRLQLHALAYNLGTFMRTLALPKEVEHWSLTTLREKLVKIGAKVVRHGRYVTFQLAEVAVPRMLFAEILRLIAQLRPPPDPAPA